jgi:(2Fe-2S) ferredoxin
MSKRFRKAREEAMRRGVGGYGRHIFLCTGPDCCSPAEGERAWDQLKRQVGELNALPGRTQAYRTKVGCLRICHNGPIAVVYPEGAWYAGVEGPALDQIVDQHLGAGQIVHEHLIASNPLPSLL